MSGDQQASSFGDPNAQPPPTPKETPTSAIFPSPVFETPRQPGQGHFDESGGSWTPSFAEEYSVFNATPGNLRGLQQGRFPDFVPATPYQHSAGQKRPLSAGGTSLDGSVLADVTTHYSPNPNAQFPPVEPSKRLASSPIENDFSAGQHGGNASQASSQHRSAKKARRGTVTQESPQGQTATPPPTARKGERKLAPKLGTEAMQNDQGFPQPDFSGGTPQQHANMGTFVTTPSDMFGYPLSAPATAPAYTNQRPFWDTDMTGMDIDFGAAGADVFQTPTPTHRAMGSVDWARSNEMFQETGMIPSSQPPGQEDPHLNNGQHALGSKPMMPGIDTSAADHSVFAATYPTPIDDPFMMVGNGGGVDPGLLFSRPPSSNVETVPFTTSSAPPQLSPVAMPPNSASAHKLVNIAPAPIVSKAPMRAEVRRTKSVKETAGSNPVPQLSASSPIKSTGRPGLSRSFSENRGKKPIARPSLPALAPAPRVSAPLTNNSGVNANRPVILQSNRPNGRTSPLKSHHHHRLSSLSSIPEALDRPRMRAQAKFTIDANGRARVETTVLVDGDEPTPQRASFVQPGSVQKRHSQASIEHHQQQPQQQWRSASEDEDDASSTDEEPIIIPSRNTSFVLPDPLKPSRKNPLVQVHASQRSVSERSNASIGSSSAQSTKAYAAFLADHDQDGDPSGRVELEGGDSGDESEAETVLNDGTPTAKMAGDAASALKRLRESRQRQHHQQPQPPHHHPSLSASKVRSGSSSKTGRHFFAGNGAGEGGGFGGQYAGDGSSTISPTSLTERSLPTPSTASRAHGVRCVCNRPEGPDGDGFLVQCESCEMWLHGRCINISKRTMPAVYICAFCANTPNVRGARIRDTGAAVGGAGGRGSVSASMVAMGPPASSATSPLAHKSFKSFR